MLYPPLVQFESSKITYFITRPRTQNVRTTQNYPIQVNSIGNLILSPHRTRYIDPIKHLPRFWLELTLTVPTIKRQLRKLRAATLRKSSDLHIDSYFRDASRSDVTSRHMTRCVTAMTSFDGIDPASIKSNPTVGSMVARRFGYFGVRIVV